MFIFSCYYRFSKKKLLTEKFISNDKQLKTQGWQLRSARIISKDGIKCLEIANFNNKWLLPYRFIKVQTGKRYVISCMMKTENVKTTRKSRRGATVFAEFADYKKKHVAGGNFPRGLFGSNDWKEFKIPFTNRIPDGVKYIKLYVGLEGKGKMWVRDLKVTSFDSWNNIKTFSPADKEIVKSKRPLFSWEGNGKKWELIIAIDPNFKKGVQRFIIGKNNKFRLPFFLPANSKWYWQVKDITNSKQMKKIFASKVNSFRVSKKAEAWPVLISSEYKWSKDSRPELTLKIIGDQNIDIKAYIDGKKCKRICFSNSKFIFRPSNDLTKGVHKCDFKLTNATGESISFSNNYCNFSPGSKVNFRKRITYVDGKAFSRLVATGIQVINCLNFQVYVKLVLILRIPTHFITEIAP